MADKISITCTYCNVVFLKKISEYNRNKKVGRNNYCSHSCCSRAVKNPRLRSHEVLHNVADLSLFKYYYKMVQNRIKRHPDFNLTILDIKEQWEKQKGICPYSGVQLSLRKLNEKRTDLIYEASIDRIDSSKGYIVGNIQFVSIPINYMKSTMNHEQMLDLCKIIAKFHTKKKRTALRLS